MLGGIVGYADGYSGSDLNCFTITFDKCRNTGNLKLKTGSSKIGMVGGMVAFVEDASMKGVATVILNSINNGNISFTSTASKSSGSAGGIVGSQESDGWSILGGYDHCPYIYNCANTGEIYANGQGEVWCGGIMGYCYDKDTQVAVCANVGYVEGHGGDLHVAEIGADNGTYINCYWLTSPKKGFNNADVYGGYGGTDTSYYPDSSENTPHYSDMVDHLNEVRANTASNNFVNKQHKTYWSDSEWTGKTVAWTWRNDCPDLIF